MRIVLFLAVVLASGCYASVSTRGHAVWVDAMPPAPLVEVVGPPPAPMYMWVAGYWTWTGAEWSWVAGRWEMPPQPGYVWVRHGWVRVGGRYQFVTGHWVAPSHRVRVEYVHPTPRVRVQTGVRYRTEQPGRHGSVRVRRPRR